MYPVGVEGQPAVGVKCCDWCEVHVAGDVVASEELQRVWACTPGLIQSAEGRNEGRGS